MEPDGRQTIYVIGYPKSGTTWLARMLGDLLDSPVGSTVNDKNHLCVAHEGDDRPGGYYIRQGHSVPSDMMNVPVIPRMGMFAWRNVTDEKVIFMQRDPLDIVVSVAHHWDLPMEKAIECMAHGLWPVDFGGGLVPYVRAWSKLHETWSFPITRYSWLSTRPHAELAYLLKAIGASRTHAEIHETVKRQSLEARRRWAQENGDGLSYGKDFQLRFLRRGVPGSWRDELPRQLWPAVEHYFGRLMVEMGYTTGPDWMEE